MEKDAILSATSASVKKHDTTFETIEGNTSLANQSNGGQVMKRNRKFAGVLFVHPNI